MLKLEREYTAYKYLIKTTERGIAHLPRPIDIFQLPPSHKDTRPMLVTVWEALGSQNLSDYVDFGPAFYGLKIHQPSMELTSSAQIDVPSFLEFAIGACECLELLHQNAIVHGEIRQDTFHWHQKTGRVCFINQGNGPRSFDNLLSSDGWATLSKELGVKNKLQFIAPEQTGRLPSDPDTRTDTYSLGVLFWCLLTGRQAFDGDTLVEIVHMILSYNLPMISSIRIDVPDALARVVAKMMQKQMDVRYHSVAGVKFDMAQIQNFLSQGDQDNIRGYQIGMHDVCSHWNLPSKQLGRHTETERIVEIIDTVRQRQDTGPALSGPGSISSLHQHNARTEIVAIVGDHGVGKSTLIKAVQAHIRLSGYFALSRFDRVRPTPFEPLTRILSSLFRQVFSEKEITTPYHEQLRCHIRSLPAIYHQILDLPATTFDAALSENSVAPNSLNGILPWKRNTILGSSGTMRPNLTHRDSGEFLRRPSSTISIRFIQTYLDLLRIMTSSKLICVCLDDLHAADAESLELITHIIEAKIHMVFLFTVRCENESLPRATQKILEIGSATKIDLKNLEEKYVLEYVAETMSQPPETVLSLAEIVYEKSLGNPLHMREVLETSYRRGCLWYDWRHSGWRFSLDKVFSETSSADSLGSFDNSFIGRRLQELPLTARAILAWASLIGNTFSYSLVQDILIDQYLYNSGQDQARDFSCPEAFKKLNLCESECIHGLQQLVNLYMIMPGETDDEFRFTHQRYLLFANKMYECRNTTKMHFIIAQAMMTHAALYQDRPYEFARHIYIAADIIKQRVGLRVRYRDILWQAALKASESGAKSTALSYYQIGIKLLQDEPWDTSHPDVFYDETLQLLVNTAELMYDQQKEHDALLIEKDVFLHARCAADKTRAYLLKGKIYSSLGEYGQAFNCLKHCLAGLGLPLPPTTWAQQDIEYKKLEYMYRGADSEQLVRRPLSEDTTLIALGTVLSDCLAAAYWYETLDWYQLVIAYVKTVIQRGNFVQAGVGFIMLATGTIGRFKDFQLASMLSETAQAYFAAYEDVWTRGRGWTVYSIFSGHLWRPLADLLPVLENALTYSLSSGDRFVGLLNLGAMAVCRLFSGHDLAEIEAFCIYGPQEFQDWELDMRGGAMLVATRQIARAWRGKTGVGNIGTVLNDDHHNTSAYWRLTTKYSSNPARARNLYESITIGAYYVYGYYDYVVEIGRRLVKGTLDELWSTRPVANARFYLAMALMAQACELPEAERGPLIEETKELQRFIDRWGQECNVNYVAWSRIIEAAIANSECRYDQIVGIIEAAIDHCQTHGFATEEAIATEYQAEYDIARGARTTSRIMIKEAIAAWNRFGAVGKAAQLTSKHEWLLTNAHLARTVHVAVQTNDLALFELLNSQGKLESNSNGLTPEYASTIVGLLDAPELELDVLDLTSILDFTRVISSELKLDVLLPKMLNIILESVGGQAEFCAIVTHYNEVGWCVSATGNHDTGATTHLNGIPIADIEDHVAQRVIHYVLRAKEAVLLQNILEDERFANVGQAYLSRHPKGRSIIVLPVIQHDQILGAVHLEGHPHAFTSRSMTVLKLLVSQLAVSLNNALLYQKVRKVSALNASMLESQKEALLAAREAEAKAKEATRAKSIFLANISHELRTPLNGVLGMSEILQGTLLDENQQGCTESIRVCADTLLTVINDILDFSKLEAGKMQVRLTPLNLKKTISEAVRISAFSNRDYGLQTIEDLAVDNIMVLGDPVRLHQILMNLLSNAFKFTSIGSVTIKAQKVAETRESIKVLCAITDTGIGITQEQLARLFQPFSQADSSSARSYGGTGLGLSICKAMIEDVLGGKISIESIPGAGTTVSFTLTFRKVSEEVSEFNGVSMHGKDLTPLSTYPLPTRSSQHEEQVKDIPAQKQHNRGNVSNEVIRVCIAEDNPINQKVAISLVKKIGYQCEAYENGALAFYALRQRSKEGNPFHLVLMDVQMPVMDGYEATKAIRKDADPNVHNVHIVALTASAIAGDLERCLEAGMNDYLAKPVRLKSLQSTLNKYLHNADTDVKSNSRH